MQGRSRLGARAAPPHEAWQEAGGFVGLLRRRASEAPDAIAYWFADGGEEPRPVGYAELDARARAVAARLVRAGVEPGGRVLLLCPPGLDYVVGLFGCLYARAVAVPAYPPDPARLERTLPRLRALVSDCRATAALTTSLVLAMADPLVGAAPELSTLRWLATDADGPGTPSDWRPPQTSADDLALLQYTSGSTDAPKGVMLRHRQLLHNSHLIRDGFELSARSVGVIWLPPYHDMGLIGGILQPLYTGFPSVLMSPLEFLRRPLSWLQAISRFRGTCSGGPNFAFELCVRKTTAEERAALDLSSWEVAFCGAEPVRADMLERFADAFAPSGFRREAFYPCYGLAETTLIVTGGRKADAPSVHGFAAEGLERGRVVPASAGEPRARSLVGCGTARPGMQVAIVDPNSGVRTEAGRVGEIWVSGPSVADGYWDAPALTDETFRARPGDAPAWPEGAGPFLRTGDLGFFHEGELFVSGRLKDLIVVRGRNHYPQDIERTAERSHPGVRPGCGAAFSVDEGGEERVVVVQEIARGGAGSERAIAEAIRAAVAREHDLRVYAVACAPAGSVPKTSSGKVQRQQCRRAFLAGELAATRVWDGPPGPDVLAAPDVRTLLSAAPDARAALLESHVVALAARAAGVSPDQIQPARSLAALGLDSLAAVELVSALERQFGVSLPAEQAVAAESLRALVASVAARLGAPRAPEPPRDEVEGPLWPGEEALWALQRVNPDDAAYNLALTAWVRSPVDLATLEEALGALVNRHASLRTRYAVVGDAPRRRVDPARPFRIDVVDVDAGGPGGADLGPALHEPAHRPFDLDGPLLRATAVRRGSELALSLVLHHVCADFWSVLVLLDELDAIIAAVRSGKPVDLPPAPNDYAAFAARARAPQAGPSLERAWAYWARQLEGAPAALNLPTDRPRGAAAPRGASYRFAIAAELADRLRALAASADATLYAVLLAAFQLLLAKYSGQDDVLVGTPVSLRPHAGFERVVGYFVNPLVVRGTVRENTSFLAWAAQIAAVVREGLRHRELPFAALVEKLKPERAPNRPPLFQVMFVFNKPQRGVARGLGPFLLEAPGARVDFGQLAFEAIAVEPRATPFELTLSLVDDGPALHGAFQYDAALFDEATIARMAGHFLGLLEAAAAEPERSVRALDVLAPAERAEILGAWGVAAPARPPAGCVHALFEAQAARTPDAVAAEFEGVELTYKALDERAEGLAKRLRALGVGPGAVVGLCVERSLLTAVGVLGALKAGGAYLPLDPAYPRERLAFMIEDSGAGVLVTEGRLLPTLPPCSAQIVLLDGPTPQAPEPAPPGTPPGADDVAYVIYTSGSTGRPKGVLLPHRALVNLIAFQLGDSAAGAGWRTLQFAPLSFDVHAQEMFSTWASGGRLVFVSEPLRRDLPALARLLAGRRVDRVFLPFAALRGLAAASEGLGPLALREVITAGEQLRITGEVAAFFEGLGDCRLFNHYGPSETHVATAHRLRGPPRAWPALPPIGRPIAGAEAYVLDRHLEPVPAGVPGEIFLGGAGLARGYLGRPALTAERFVPHPFGAEPGSRLYRTGDLARFLPDGSLQFLGRVDHQVKVRGYRVEPEEVEAALETHDALGEAAVVARQGPEGATLVSYVAPRENLPAPTAAELSAHLRRTLPEYMIPAAFVVLDALPKTPNGKVDRRALPAPSPRTRAGEAAPRTPVERALVRAWEEALGVAGVGVDDDFFSLGGHSLVAIRVVARVRRLLGVELPVRALFEAPTVARLAELVEAARREALPPVERVPRGDGLPLSFSQQRLWFLDQLDPGSSAYNLPAAVRLRGRLGVDALGKSIERVVARHEALRTTFPAVRGEPRQLVADVVAVPLPLVDLGDLPAAEREAELHRLAAEEARRPFDLQEGPLLRAALVRLGEADHVLLLTAHHIVADGWSLGVLVRELSAFYGELTGGGPARLPELAVQYPDFAAWQRRWADGEALAAQLEYWKRQLGGGPAPLELPADRPRPARQSFRGSSYAFRLPPPLTTALRGLCAREGVTLFMALLAAFETLLHRYTEQDDVAVGAPVAGRPLVETEPLIGCFVNTLVLRADLSGDPTFRELLGRVRELTLSAYANQDLPFERVVEAIAPARELGRSPLFQVLFSLQSAPPPLTLGGVDASLMDDAIQTSKFDLGLYVDDEGGELRCRLEYSSDLFDPPTIERAAAHFRALVAGAVADPGGRLSELPLLSEGERRTVLVAWNATDREGPREVCAHELFEEQARRAPGATALIFRGEALSYGELEVRAGRLARRLRALGVGPGTLVGIFLERSAEAVVAILAALKAGGAYVPLDPGWPAARSRAAIASLGLRHVVTAAPQIGALHAALEGLPRGHEVAVVCPAPDGAHEAADVPARGRPAARAATAADLAYVLFTSGSTGVPKGVAVRHASVVNLVEWMNRTHEVGPLDRALFVTSLCFDLSVYDLFGVLAAGGSLLIASEDDVRDPWALASALRSGGVTLWNSAPSVLESALGAIPEGPLPPGERRLRHVFLSGDRLPVTLPDRVRARFPGAHVVNLGGPTEATVWHNYYTVGAVDPRWSSIPYGRPIQNARCYILDRHLNPMPIGVPGDLYVAGACLSVGYYGSPRLTAERFVPNPFSSAPGARMYQTGDRARYLPDGNVEFLGRRDGQVKLRGYRVELGEVEAALVQHPRVSQAVAVLREGDPGGRHITAYVVAKGAPPPDPAELREAARRRLPDYMVPTAFVTLPAIPLTSTGKIDRRALPAPGPAVEGVYVAPVTPVELALASIWAEVLGLERVSAEADFFALGGHSLLATQVVARARRHFGVDLPVRSLFEAPTLAAFARHVEAAGSPVEPARPIGRAPRDRTLPLSFAQQRLWFLDRLEPGAATYNIPVALRIVGPLRASSLGEALREVLRRHEALRTTFPADRGEPRQAIADDAEVSLLEVDLSALPEGVREAEARRIEAEEARQPFDLARGPLLRARLLRQGARDHVLLLTAHHIVADGWSMGVFVRELSALYGAFSAGAPPALPELPIQYADYAVWQREQARKGALEAGLAYWKERLKGPPSPLDLPVDRPRPREQTYRGAAHPFSLPPELVGALDALCLREGVTRFMALLAAFQVLLHRYTRQVDVAVGSPIAGRDRVETEGLVGLFVNTLVLRTDLSGRPSFRGVLGRVREVTLGAYEHHEVPFEKLVEALAPERNLGRTPLFQAMFVLQSAPLPPPALEGTTVEPLEVEGGAAKFDLTLSLTEAGGGLRGRLEYNADLFDAQTAARMAGHFALLLAGAVDDPTRPVAELPLLTADERRLVLGAWAGVAPARDAPDGPGAAPPETVLDRIEAQSGLTPHAIAAVCGQECLTYAELDGRAERLARRLRARGVGPEARVGLYVERSLEAVVGVLGVLKAGGAYVPLDPSYPAERLGFMLRDAGVTLVVSRASLLGEATALRGVDAVLVDEGAEEGADAEPPRARRPSSGNAAYVIYTSGSTGAPKGVVVSHANLASSTWARLEHYRERVTAFLLVSSLSFDSSVAGLFWTLCQGGTLVLPKDGVAQDPAALAALVARHGVSHLLAIPALYLMLLERASPEQLAPLRAAIVAGEACPPALPERHRERAPAARLHNEYGPTEATVWSTVHGCTVDGARPRVPVGRPVAGARAYVLDPALQPVPPGAPGELYVGGAGVARGYLGRPALTAERFVPDPFGRPGARLYKTGDLAKYLPDGSLDFLGRVDHQVKVRGVRVELEEVEAALERHEAVARAAVAARGQAADDLRLVAYLVAAREPPPSQAELVALLRHRLPEAMLPSAFVWLDALPQTPAGKIDRAALPAPAGGRLADAATFVAPQTEVERRVAAAWQDLLRVERVGRHDSFFDLGGHSLLLARLQGKLEEAFSRPVPIVELFRHPTVKDQAAYLSRPAGAPAGGAPRDDRSSLVEAGRARAQQRLARARRGKE